MSNMTVADVLERAADLIEPVGTGARRMNAFAHIQCRDVLDAGADPFAWARQNIRDVPPVLVRCVDQDPAWHALIFKEGPLTASEQAWVDAVERSAE